VFLVRKPRIEHRRRSGVAGILLAPLKAARQPTQNFLSYLQTWRREMIAKGLPLSSEDELRALRDRSPALSRELDE